MAYSSLTSGSAISQVRFSPISNGHDLLDEVRCTSSVDNHAHGTKDGVALHCTDRLAQGNDFMNTRSLDGINNRINSLWSGAYLYKEGTNTQNNRSYIQIHGVNGVPNGSNHMHMINLFGNGWAASSTKEVYIHEMSHAWGALDHYHDKSDPKNCLAGKRGVCSEAGCPAFKDCTDVNKVHRPSKCMMNDHTWLSRADSIQEIYCSYCLADMKNHVSTYYQ